MNKKKNTRSKNIPTHQTHQIPTRYIVFQLARRNGIAKSAATFHESSLHREHSNRGTLPTSRPWVGGWGRRVGEKGWLDGSQMGPSPQLHTMAWYRYDATQMTSLGFSRPTVDIQDAGNTDDGGAWKLRARLTGNIIYWEAMRITYRSAICLF